jgi:hypothetical protein
MIDGAEYVQMRVESVHVVMTRFPLGVEEVRARQNRGFMQVIWRK